MGSAVVVQANGWQVLVQLPMKRRVDAGLADRVAGGRVPQSHCAVAADRGRRQSGVG
jgi:hypothetical protein